MKPIPKYSFQIDLRGDYCLQTMVGSVGSVTFTLAGTKLSNIPMISIIDNDELVRDAIKNLVRSLGYVAATFASAEEYLQSGHVWSSSCLITDIQMPGMSGAELQDHLIADSNPVPVIFMTAFADENIRTRVLTAGASDFLKKPFDDNSLVACLEKALQTRSHA